MTKMAEASSAHSLTPSKFQSYYVIRTKAGKEDEAAKHLLNQADSDRPISVYAPRVNERRANGVKTKHVARPLFSRYIFAAFDLEQWFYRISYTRGVSGLLRFADEFALIQRELLEDIAAQTVNGFVQVREREVIPQFDFAIGEVVRIIRGSWDGQEVSVAGFKGDNLILERDGPCGKKVSIVLPPYAVVAAF